MRRNDREVTDIGGIEEILKMCKICRLAMVDDGMPYVVPLNFGYTILDGNVLELYFHSALEGRKLDVLRRNNKVCAEISHEGEPLYAEVPCKSGTYYSSVIGFGEATIIEDVDEKCKALAVLFKHQADREVTFTAEQAATVCVFKVVSTDFTGKQKPIA